MKPAASNTSGTSDMQVIGTANTTVPQRFKPRLNITTSVALPPEFYNEIQDYIDTVSEQLVANKFEEARQHIKAEYEEKFLTLLKQLEPQKIMPQSQQFEDVISGINQMAIPEFLESIILNPIANGYHIAFIHSFEDRVKALQEIEQLLSSIQDRYPTLNFEPTILHITDTESYSSTGIRITGKK
jgi:hypothetical protein